MAYCTQTDLEQRIGLVNLAALTNDIWQVSAPSSPSATASSGGSLTADTTYYYVVTAYSEKGETVQSSEVNATTTSVNKKITVSWTSVSGAKIYKVYRSTTTNSYTTPCFLAQTTSTSYADSGSVTLTAGAPQSDAFSPNSGVITALIARADNCIEAYAGQVYTVPFPTTPDIVKEISIDLACYYAFQRRPLNMEMPKEWEDIYKSAMDKLEKISNMLLRLPATATIASAESNMQVSNTARIDFTNEDNSEYYF
jgi:phage gp36-like protein